MITRYCIIVRGRVQRVGFRASTRRKAQALGVVGSAINESDGSVRVIAQGEQDDLTALLEWLHHGPVLARVDEVVWEQQEADESCGTSFSER